MSNTADHLKLCEAILDLIEKKRAETADPSLGESIESVILQSQIHDLERDIFNQPGALEPWLVRLRPPGQ
jgi:hypothetical protein